MYKQADIGGADIRAPQRSRRELLESSKVARLQSLPKQPKAKPDNACETCDKGRLEPENELQQRTRVCRKCIAHYALIDSAFNKAADAKARSAKIANLAKKLNQGEKNL